MHPSAMHELDAALARGNEVERHRCRVRLQTFRAMLDAGLVITSVDGPHAARNARLWDEVVDEMTVRALSSSCL